MSAGNTPEARARHAAANTSEKGRKGREASGWNRAPMCEGTKALSSWNQYRANGK